MLTKQKEGSLFVLIAYCVSNIVGKGGANIRQRAATHTCLERKMNSMTEEGKAEQFSVPEDFRRVCRYWWKSGKAAKPPVGWKVGNVVRD